MNRPKNAGIIETPNTIAMKTPQSSIGRKFIRTCWKLVIIAVTKSISRSSNSGKAKTVIINNNKQIRAWKLPLMKSVNVFHISICFI